MKSLMAAALCLALCAGVNAANKRNDDYSVGSAPGGNGTPVNQGIAAGQARNATRATQEIIPKQPNASQKERAREKANDPYQKSR